jgi:hypothetical protein
MILIFRELIYQRQTKHGYTENCFISLVMTAMKKQGSILSGLRRGELARCGGSSL